MKIIHNRDDLYEINNDDSSDVCILTEEEYVEKSIKLGYEIKEIEDYTDDLILYSSECKNARIDGKYLELKRDLKDLIIEQRNNKKNYCIFVSLSNQEYVAEGEHKERFDELCEQFRAR
jgi:hypothetical protein